MTVKGKMRAKIARTIRGAFNKQKVEGAFDMEKGPVWATKFVNKTDHEQGIFEKGKLMLIMLPRRTAVIESWKPSTTWARWSEVVFRKDGRVDLVENPTWQNPWRDHPWTIELVNEDASEEESLAVLLPNPAVDGPESYVRVQRGIPRIIPLNLWDPLTKFSKIIWHAKEMKIPIPGTKYITRRVEVTKEYVPRSKADLKRLLKARKEEEMARLAEESRKMMERVEREFGELGDENHTH
jgi:hypothetical protein